jgi:hypothetical protein
VTYYLTRAVGQAAAVAPIAFTTSEIEILFMRTNLTEFQPRPSSGSQRYAKTALVASTLVAAQKAASQGDQDVEDGLKRFIEIVAEKVDGDDLGELVSACQSIGYDLRRTGGSMRLLPLDDPAAPLSRAITAFEADLDRLGLNVAKTHYRQAIDNLIDNNPEAANGQIRTTFEAVIVHFATSEGFAASKQGSGLKAIEYLIGKGLLPARDGGNYIRGLWEITHTNGPHPGTSPSGEAFFRVQALTSACRYLIDRLS